MTPPPSGVHADYLLFINGKAVGVLEAILGDLELRVSANARPR